MAKTAVTSQSGFQDLLHGINDELTNVDRYAALADAERKST